MKSLLTTLTFFTLIQTHARSDLAKALGGLEVEDDRASLFGRASTLVRSNLVRCSM